MYRVMLVEDEALVRNSMAENVAWAEYGFELSAICEDGRQAISKLNIELPDVVITDICMPFMDGLELARYICEHYPSVLVLVLTGFNEFAYAQQAIKLHVYDYILKPVSLKELGTILFNLRLELDRRYEETQRLVKLKSEALHAAPVLRNKFFYELTAQSADPNWALEAAERNGISFCGDTFAACIAEVDDMPAARSALAGAARELLYFVVFNIAAEIAQTMPGCFAAQLGGRKTLLVISGSEEASVNEAAAALCTKVIDEVQKNCHFTISIGVGSANFGLAALALSKQEAEEALGYGFILGQGKCIEYASMKKQEALHFGSQIDLDENRIISALRQCEPEAAIAAVKELFSGFRKHFMQYSRCQPYLDRLRVALSGLSREYKAEDDPVILECSLEQQEHWMLADAREHALIRACRRLCECSRLMAVDPASQCAKQAEAYIQEHCFDSELSLSDVISNLCVSKSYFSAAFKQHTGLTFVEYLTRLRMEKAKEYLRTTALRTYEIAERVGYCDPHYFSVTFKRYSGKTPKEYRG